MLAIKNNLPSLIEQSAQSTEEILEELNSFMPEFLNIGLQIIDALTDGIIQAMPYIIAMIPSWVENLVYQWMGMMYLWIDIGYNILRGIGKGVIEALPQVKNQFVDACRRMVERVKEFFGVHSPSTMFADIGKNLIQGLINGISSMVGSLVSRARSFASQLVSSFNGMNLFSIGQNLLTGLWNGISNKVSWVTSKIRGMSSSIISAIKGVFGVHSPSTEFAYIGEMNMEGLSIGMMDKQKEIQSQIDGMFELQPSVSPMMTIQQEQPSMISAFQEMLTNFQERPVLIDVRADEGIIVQKATEGFREFQRANGRLPF